MQTPSNSKTAVAVAHSHEHPGAPAQRTTLAHVIDSVALLGYFAAIGMAATLLAIPHPWVLAGAISLTCLVAMGSGRIGAFLTQSTRPPAP